MGISGAGKTTLGRRLKSSLEDLEKRVYMIDGDAVRAYYENDLGYTAQDREQNIKRIMFAAHALSECGIIVIVCNISPFEKLREFARRKIRGYSEIYLKKRLDASMEDDVKEMYKNNLGKMPIAGVDLEFEEPKNSDLTIEVDGETAEESLKKILRHIEGLLASSEFCHAR